MAGVLKSESAILSELLWSVLETLVLAFSIVHLKVIEIQFDFDLEQKLHVDEIACSYLMLNLPDNFKLPTSAVQLLRFSTKEKEITFDICINNLDLSIFLSFFSNS